MALCRASLMILFVGVLLLNLMAVTPGCVTVLKSFCAVYTERTSEPCSLESEPVIKFPVKLSTYVIP